MNCIISIDAMKIDEDLSFDHKNQIDGLISSKNFKLPKNIHKNKDKYAAIFEKELQKNNIVSSMFVTSICPFSNIKAFPLSIYLILCQQIVRF